MPQESITRTKKQLASENENLHTRLAEAEEALRAIRSGDWDALIISGLGGEQIVTLKHSELRYRRLFEATPDGILILNAETGAITDVNPFLINVLGYAREEFIGKRLWEVGAFKDVEASQHIFEALHANDYIRYEDIPLKVRDGHLIQVELVSNIYAVDDQKVIQCNIRDITKRKQVQAALETLLREQSIRDHLTGLFNRRYMEETLERELRRAIRKNLSLGIIMFDVDDFKHFNDTYGHAAGDGILRELGNFLISHVRVEDIACRYGGDEFIVILPDAPQEVTEQRAKLIYEFAKQFHLPFEGQILEAVTLSIGTAIFPKDGSSSTDILKFVDDALYLTKREGQGRTLK
ncbi:MAG: GGDEF domain-containing protein [Anaerolineales bacterium]|nr:GGDEF domain-containing protein [Anaerolineales bacterium]